MMKYGPRVDEATRFWRKVDIRSEDECWEWTGSRSHNGYGWFHRTGGAQARANRFVIELTTGKKVRRDLMVCHRCDNPRCVNPKHLFVGSARTNIRDAQHKGRTLRRRQHPGKGIRPWKGKWQAYIEVAGRTSSKAFPLDTDEQTMKAWRVETRLVKLAELGIILPDACT